MFPRGLKLHPHLLPLISTGLGSQRRSPAPKDLGSSGRHRHGELAISHRVRQTDVTVRLTRRERTTGAQRQAAESLAPLEMNL